MPHFPQLVSLGLRATEIGKAKAKGIFLSSLQQSGKPVVAASPASYCIVLFCSEFVFVNLLCAIIVERQAIWLLNQSINMFTVFITGKVVPPFQRPQPEGIEQWQRLKESMHFLWALSNFRFWPLLVCRWPFLVAYRPCQTRANMENPQ